MEGRTSKLAITAGLVGLIVAATIAIGWGHDDRPVVSSPVVAPVPAEPDNLNAELERCNQLGPNDKPDQACLDAWAAARRHFLGGRS